MKRRTVDGIISPEGGLDVLSRMEVSNLRHSSKNGYYEAFRLCSLAVLNCGNEGQYGYSLIEEYEDFQINVIQQEKGIQLAVKNAPATAFVDGEMIQGIKEHLFSVLRDIIYVGNEIYNNERFDLASSAGITNGVFHILRNAQVLKPHQQPNLAVCWGGHSINRSEYEYTKLVGYEMGLRGLNICTGCGPGAMKGPMKGAAVGHAKQRICNGRYIGLTEPGIIAAESPNPIVNELVIMPDIEKRLEAFVRMGHAIVIFPGGVGTMEELLFLLGLLLNPDNDEMPFTVILTGQKSSEEYFLDIDRFIGKTLGDDAQKKYQIIINDPVKVAREVKRGMEQVRAYRERKEDAYYFNWLLTVDPEFQLPFRPTHKSMAELKLHQDQPMHELAADLRRAFSGIVAGNIKDEGRLAIKKNGPFKLNGDEGMMKAMDQLLQAFVAQNRMAIMGNKYQPCYEINS